MEENIDFEALSNFFYKQFFKNVNNNYYNCFWKTKKKERRVDTM